MKAQTLLLATSSLFVAKHLLDTPTALAQPIETSTDPPLPSQNQPETSQPLAAKPAVTQPEAQPIESSSTQASQLPVLEVNQSGIKELERSAPQPQPAITQPETIDQPARTVEQRRTAEAMGDRSAPAGDPHATVIDRPAANPGSSSFSNPSPDSSQNPSSNPSPDQPSTLQAPSSTPATTSATPANLTGSFQIAPHRVAEHPLPPLMTTLPLNGTAISHLTQWEMTDSYTFGENRSSNFDLSAIYRLSGRVEQSLSRDNVFTSDQRGVYLQAQTVRSERTVELMQRDPRTMLGMTMRESFTGVCPRRMPAGTPAGSQCALMPALVTDRRSINQNFIPTRINQRGNVGDIVTPQTLDSLAQPGFQGVGPNGQTVGLDLYFPNTGLIPGNSHSDRATITRRESISTNPLVGIASVRQIIQANDHRAVLGRTIRGFGLLIDDDNALLNGAVALASQLLPDVRPHLDGSTNPASTYINLNLFRAANSAWTPTGWTFYQAGIGAANHARQGESIRIPSAHYDNIWIGMSPVTDRNSHTDTRIIATGPERVVASAGSEGGARDNISFVSNVNGQLFNSDSMRNFYAQIYLKFTKRDVDLVSVSRFTETTQYYPHISYSGNIASNHQLFRYYVGAIASDSVKAYLGADYTARSNQWSFNIGSIGYLNPDRDYFSHVETSLAHQIRLGSQANLVFNAGLRYAFGISSNPLDDPVDNYVSVGANLNLGSFSLGLTQYFGDILPQSIDSALGASASLQLGQLSLSAYYAPSNNQHSYGADAALHFGQGYNSPTLAFSWRKDAYEYGSDGSGHSLSSENNVYTITLRLGAPASPFAREVRR